MSPNATSDDLAITHEMNPENKDNTKPGPSTQPALGTTATAADQGISQMQRLHASIQEERQAHIKEAQRLEAQYQAEREEKERLEAAAQKAAAQKAKDEAQKARIERAVQATPEERAAYEEALEARDAMRRAERSRANTLGRINGYLEAWGKKPRR
ncbi:hypothetical protein HER10_EVM0008839 [Colletotrichum scovillei]|uniref:Uncharacterized protein n=1 Tax=Colletotrichum scovillei TaxID=1209932 RepID=A0A9P7QYM1_9PEZI|nr:uncharacterized protein HER10_EVM0008839 [Colletotrichum scovillei]KAF4781219.1 hypothetical protein HER10_EVM0008839 [Colletotrichum scovillei]KAG7045608.1 hypothetical protein JMJ77_0009686 [Colletotrichum scovillei]KAG7052768.1 hypothetical protein JMJ78_0005779 [Colletotrichum scovillei]KAG7065061.1 hypothetical protein JMJ76_0012813 [Colletotrichum scovillei]